MPTTPTKISIRKTLSGVAPLARKLGVTPGHLSRVVHGERKASPALKLRLARMGITTTVDGEAL